MVVKKKGRIFHHDINVRDSFPCQVFLQTLESSFWHLQLCPHMVVNFHWKFFQGQTFFFKIQGSNDPILWQLHGVGSGSWSVFGFHTHEGTPDTLLGSLCFFIQLLGVQGLLVYFSRCCDRLSSMDFTTKDVKKPSSGRARWIWINLSSWTFMNDWPFFTSAVVESGGKHNSNAATVFRLFE